MKRILSVEVSFVLVFVLSLSLRVGIIIRSLRLEYEYGGEFFLLADAPRSSTTKERIRCEEDGGEKWITKSSSIISILIDREVIVVGKDRST